ncbi:hypothetical protein BBP40_005733 [Aspergillus hancockii]|nr:hypothetical protein BBP40_005733 [Aspergillus hancockii]
MSQIHVGPSYDQELGPLSLQPTISTADIPNLRDMTRSKLEDVLRYRQVQHELHAIPGPSGEIELSVFRPSGSSRSCWRNTPGIFYIHAGGMIAGNRFTGLEIVLDHVEQEQAICITVEYRLAPEHMHPVPLEDCYAAFKWTSDNATSLGFSATRLVIAGMSAGGGLAAGVALLSRDCGGPKICAQILISPMLDDRNATVSSLQYANSGPWSQASNVFAWNCLLNGHQGDADVSMYAAPGRASDLSGLPPTYVEVGSADVFRDEDVAYAARLWKYGVQTELHVWPGGWHGFQIYSPGSKLSKIAAETRRSWLWRQLSYLEARVPEGI